MPYGKTIEVVAETFTTCWRRFRKKVPSRRLG